MPPVSSCNYPLPCRELRLILTGQLPATPSPSKRAGNKAKKIKVEDFDDDSEASEHEDNDRDKHPEAEYTP